MNINITLTSPVSHLRTGRTHTHRDHDIPLDPATAHALQLAIIDTLDHMLGDSDNPEAVQYLIEDLRMDNANSLQGVKAQAQAQLDQSIERTAQAQRILSDLT